MAATCCSRWRTVGGDRGKFGAVLSDRRDPRRITQRWRTWSARVLDAQRVAAIENSDFSDPTYSAITDRGSVHRQSRARAIQAVDRSKARFAAAELERQR